LNDYLVGTGGWAYFNVPNNSALKKYAEVFNFVEVNYTFYEYPSRRTVENWRRRVPEDFTFSVRCHQDLTHRIGLKPVDEAYYVLSQMIAYCEELDASSLVLETPNRYVFNQEEVDRTRDFLSSINLRGVRLAWEIRSPITPALTGLMQDLDIIHCVDLSKEMPSFKTDVVYSRLFGKGQHNLYQFTDAELVEIDQKAKKTNSKTVVLSYHGARMFSDAVRFTKYKKTGNFMPVTSFIGVESAKAVLAEDAHFPSSKAELIDHQGWKVVDLTSKKRVHLSELLANIPEKQYNSLDEVTSALRRFI
jgi:uncharacterized protein YecE (DUF72 family)